MRVRVALGIAFLAVGACQPASPSGSEGPASAGPPSGDQVLRMAYAEAGTLDPHLSADATVGLLVRGLTWLDEDLRTVPGLAEDWDISADATEITFHFREASYSSGEPITAGDVVFSWRRLLDPRTGSSLGFSSPTSRAPRTC